MSSIADSLKLAEERLAKSGVADPRREAASLLSLALAKDKTFFYAHPEHRLSDDDVAMFERLIGRRVNREPLQYISGVQEFYGLDFEVTPDVLIPRPETEILVEHAIVILRGRSTARFCEVGVGSGCISVSILFHVAGATAVGLDISRTALDVAGRNAARHGVADWLSLLESDVFANLSAPGFDLIVSNPPYVPFKDMADLQPEVRDFEPHRALTDGADGLSVIARIISEAPRYLRPDGQLLMEIGFDQSGSVASMFDPAVWRTAEFYPDLQGIPRVAHARLI